MDAEGKSRTKRRRGPAPIWNQTLVFKDVLLPSPEHIESECSFCTRTAYGPSWPKHTTLVVVELVAEHVLPPERRVAAPLLALRTVPR